MEFSYNFIVYMLVKGLIIMVQIVLLLNLTFVWEHTIKISILIE